MIVKARKKNQQYSERDSRTSRATYDLESMCEIIKIKYIIGRNLCEK